MPLRRNNTNTFHRVLYGGQLESIQLLKRDNDQREGVVTKYILYQARQKAVAHSGEPLLGTMAAQDFTVWSIPRIELQRVGIADLNALDRIIGEDGQTWQPESGEDIGIKLFKNTVDVVCRRVDQ